MKHIILLILLTLGILAQEVGVPYVQMNKTLAPVNYSFFVLNGTALLFEENKHLCLWNFKDLALNQCLGEDDLKNYQVTALQLKGRELIPHRWFNTLAANSDTMYLSFDGRIERWDIKTWKKIDEFETPIYDKWGNRETFDILMIDDDAHKLIAGSSELAGYEHFVYPLYLFDLPSMKVLQKFYGHKNHVGAISKIIDDKYFFSTSSGDESLRKWDIKTGNEINSIKNIKIYTNLQLSKDNKFIKFAEWDQNISVYTVDDLKLIRSFNVKNKNILSFLDNDKSIFGSIPKDKLIVEWDMKTGEEIQQIQMLRSAGSLILSPNKRYIGGQLGNMLTFWSLPNYKETIVLYPINNCDWIATTPDGSFNASEGAITSIRIKDANGTERALTPEEIKKYKQPKKIQAILNDIISTNKMEQ